MGIERGQTIYYIFVHMPDARKQRSNLTLKLLETDHRKVSEYRKEMLMEVTVRLTQRYGTPSLGNFRDPVKEIFYIVLSARTTDALYRAAHAKLMQKYRTLDMLAKASRKGIEKCIRGAGFGVKRAEHLLEIARRLVVELGRHPRATLRSMDASTAYKFLTSLPGVGPKSAFCVMMCSLDFDVFPVDINVQRIFERMGLIVPGLKHYEAQRIAPLGVPIGCSKGLHVGLVEHGRRVCLPLRPRCENCILIDMCRYGRKQKRHKAKQKF
jgi:endonuclease III